MALIEAMPDGQGGWQPVPALMTEAEVVRFLRLDTDDGCDPAQTLARYRNAGQLVGVKVGRWLRYRRQDVEEFLAHKSEQKKRAAARYCGGPMVLSIAKAKDKHRGRLWASVLGVTLPTNLSLSRRQRLDRACRIQHTVGMVDIRQSILDRMAELGWTINHVSVLVKDRIPRRTIYAYLTGQSDARTEVASALMDALGLTITSKPVKRAKRPRKER